MTRLGGSPRGPRRASATDPYGLGPVTTLVAPLGALVGLVVVAALTLGVINGQLPVPGAGTGNGGNGNGNPDGGPRSPAPSNVVVVDPRADVPGSIVYVKAGNVWIQSGKDVRQVTSSGTASMATWGPAGEWIYYVDSIEDKGRFPAKGEDREYVMHYPNLMRVHPDGSGAEKVATGKFKQGRYTWFFWIREPAVSPDGETVALTSDGPDPTKRNVVVQLLDLDSGKFTRPNLPETAPLGHQNPEWRPDGKQLLYVRNGRNGARGAPQIYRYNVDTGRTAAMTGPGYLAPSYSPDGRYVAATRTDSFGTDVVILDARTGGELLRLTNDGVSWSPTWSPKGDAIAYLHLDSGSVDLEMVPLTSTGPAWTLGETLALTTFSGLDGSSRPHWFIPADQLPPPTPSPAAASPSGGAPSGTTAP